MSIGHHFVEPKKYLRQVWGRLMGKPMGDCATHPHIINILYYHLKKSLDQE